MGPRSPPRGRCGAGHSRTAMRRQQGSSSGVPAGSRPSMIGSGFPVPRLARSPPPTIRAHPRSAPRRIKSCLDLPPSEPRSCSATIPFGPTRAGPSARAAEAGALPLGFGRSTGPPIWWPAPSPDAARGSAGAAAGEPAGRVSDTRERSTTPDVCANLAVGAGGSILLRTRGFLGSRPLARASVWFAATGISMAGASSFASAAGAVGAGAGLGAGLGAVAGCGAATGGGGADGGAGFGATGAGAGTGAGGAAGAGGGVGAARGGRSESGSTYVSPSPTRIPRWTYGTSCSGTPEGPGSATGSPSATMSPRPTISVPRCVSDAL